MPPGRNHRSRHESPNFTLSKPPHPVQPSWEVKADKINKHVSAAKSLIFRLPFGTKSSRKGKGSKRVVGGWLAALQFMLSDHGIEDFVPPVADAVRDENDDDVSSGDFDQDATKQNNKSKPPTRPTIETTILDTTTWTPVTQLGAGGFGRVGLWRETRISDGAIMDEMVIKQQELIPAEFGKQFDTSIRGDYAGVGVHWEAIVMEGLQNKERDVLAAEAADGERPRWVQGKDANQGGGERRVYTDKDTHITRIRQYKYARSQQLCRLYLVYCPHGTLKDLVRDYHAWNRDLPDAFLWHLFHSLALAIHLMSSPLPRTSFLHACRTHRNEPDWSHTPNHWFLHNDIKAANILLSYSGAEHDSADAVPQTRKFGVQEDLTKSFPSIKLADFGVASYTSDVDKHNPTRGQLGTPTNFPPEQSKWRRDFRDPPNWTGQRHSREHMVWQVGKVVMDAMEHWPENHIANLLNTTDEATYRARANHFLHHSFLQNPSTDTTLTALLLKCLRPAASERPSPTELLKATSAGLAAALNRKAATEKLYYKDREIGDAELGDHRDFEATDEDYYKVRYRDPERPVKMPEGKWEKQIREEDDMVREFAKKAKLRLDHFVRNGSTDGVAGYSRPDATSGPNTGGGLSRNPDEEQFSFSVDSDDLSDDEDEDDDEDEGQDDDDEMEDDDAESDYESNVDEDDAEDKHNEDNSDDVQPPVPPRIPDRPARDFLPPLRVRSNAEPQTTDPDRTRVASPRRSTSPKSTSTLPGLHRSENLQPFLQGIAQAANVDAGDNDDNSHNDRAAAPNDIANVQLHDAQSHIDNDDNDNNDSLNEDILKPPHEDPSQPANAPSPDQSPPAPTTQDYLAQKYADLYQQIKEQDIKLEKGAKRTKAVFARLLRGADDAGVGKKRERENIDREDDDVDAAGAGRRKKVAKKMLPAAQETAPLPPRRTRAQARKAAAGKES